MKPLNLPAQSLKESVFSTITQKAGAHSAINLAQGFPDFDTPSWVLEIAERVLHQQKNQYAPSMGVPALRKAIADLYTHFYDLSFDPDREILVTNGATEAIYATIRAVVNPGDEVVAFEPLYDSYGASVHLAQGVLKPVTLKMPNFEFSREDLLAQVGEKTKLLIFNNPHNPTGRVFTFDEMEFIGELATKYDFYILSDEVYEYLNFQGEHQPLASFPSLRDRVITVSSVGKTLSLTGWKIGWACGPEHLIKTIHNIHQYLCFCVSHPFQAVMAEALPQWKNYVTDFYEEYSQRRRLLVSGLEELGAHVFTPQGTYFALVQTPEGKTDWEFCEELILKHKVATIPLSPFYLKSQEGQSLVRFCFAKKTETIQQALVNIQGAQF